MGYKLPLNRTELCLTALVLLALVLPCAGQQVNATGRSETPVALSCPR